MISATIFMVGLGVFCGLALSVASRVFYVYEDPRIAFVENCFAGANCGGCGYAGCSAAAVAVVAGEASPSVCIVGGAEAAIGASEVMGVDAGTAEAIRSYNGCTGGDRAVDRFIYQGVSSCKAQTLLYGGKRDCEIGCIGCTACSRKADLIQMGGNLPIIDYGSYDHSADFEIAMDKCPRGSMLYVGKPTAKDIAAVAGEELPARIEADFKTTVDETEWRG
jgi:formate dehydrogenase beta subunit